VDRVGKIQGEEEYHLEHAGNWLERLADGENGTEHLQEALDRLFPHALTLFEPTDPDVEEDIVDLGLRTATLQDMGEEWLSIVLPFLESLDLTVPEGGLAAADGYAVTGKMLPAVRGRDGSHGEAWDELFADLTNTYRELERDRPTKIMEQP
ncbi:phenylacetate-CoA oxygenase subunit PaaI, partial [Halobacteriales archaeon QH_2_66_30]